MGLEMEVKRAVLKEVAWRKWGHPIYSPFFYGGFLLPYILLAYTLDISVAEGKYGRYRSCPYFLL